MRYRGGVFALSGKFYAMPERITHLRCQSDLGGLEPELLELAMQMSLQSRDLRDIPPTLGYELEDGGTQPNLVPMPKK